MDKSAPGLPAVARSAMAKARGLFTSLHTPGAGSEDEVLRRAASVLTRTGEEFLPAVAREIADMLHADLAFVGELTGTDRLRTVAVCSNGEMIDNIDYTLAGTPLEHTADRSTPAT